MKYSRKCLVCHKEVISSNKRTFTHPECVGRTPILPVAIKTAEAFLREQIGWAGSGNTVIPAIHFHDIVKVVEAYHAQFKPTPTEGKGIEGVKEAAKSYSDNTYSDPPFTAKAFEAGAAWQSQQGKEAKTIRELRDLISHLAEYCPIYEEEYWSKIREALKTKK